jgi:hypothetical protein
MTPDEIQRRLADETQHCTNVVGPSGAEYQIEVASVRDGNGLRLLGGIDDGRLRAFFPLCDEISVRMSGRKEGNVG